MLIIPTQPVPAQTLSVILAGQNVQLLITQNSTGMYMTIFLDGNAVPMLAGVICQAENRIVRNAYFGFVGDLWWIDNSGAGEDPYYTGLGDRWELGYLTEDDLAGADG